MSGESPVPFPAFGSVAKQASAPQNSSSSCGADDATGLLGS